MEDARLVGKFQVVMKVIHVNTGTYKYWHLWCNLYRSYLITFEYITSCFILFFVVDILLHVNMLILICCFFSFVVKLSLRFTRSKTIFFFKALLHGLFLSKLFYFNFLPFCSRISSFELYQNGAQKYDGFIADRRVSLNVLLSTKCWCIMNINMGLFSESFFCSMW